MLAPPGGGPRAVPPGVAPPGAAPRPELGNTPLEAFRVAAAADDEAEAAAEEARAAAAAAAASSAPPPMPPFPVTRLVFGVLLFGTGVTAVALGAEQQEAGLAAAGALAIVPGAYVLFTFFAVYVLRRRDLFHELHD